MFNNIYDIGANQGQNIKYFLQNGEKVVAVEPIKELCSKINKNFKKSIDSGQLSILNSAVVVDEDVKITELYLNKKKTWESTLLNNNKFQKINVNATSLNKIFSEYGSPDCLKIDVEGYDLELLKYMVSSNILPNYLIIEIQNKETLYYLMENFLYKYFNFVLGHRISKDYRRINLKTHSSGPLGNDLKFKWVNKQVIKFYFLFLKYGWIDIHCTNLKYENENMLGYYKTILYIFSDKIFRKVNPLIDKIFGKIQSFMNNLNR